MLFWVVIVVQVISVFGEFVAVKKSADDVHNKNQRIEELETCNINNLDNLIVYSALLFAMRKVIP